jgi:esterase/lipase
MKGIVFLIAGFEINRTAAHDEYKLLREAIESKNYKVVPVDINWKHHTMSKFVREFTDLYKQRASKHNIIIGNSFGAMVALITAAELKPDKIVLCSLSPFFKEDIPRFHPEEKLYKWFGRRRVDDFRTISAEALAEAINNTKVQSVHFYGEKEKKIYKKLVDRVVSTAKDLHSPAVEIPDAPHSFSDSAYVEAITAVL